ncbi:MAG: tetratricopeptide repeat protein, partial [Solirubrobacteraceae bacterium]
VACLLAIAMPLATASAVRASQAAASSGDPAAALADARTAARLEPSAASPQLQLALVLEAQGDFRDAVLAARRATLDEPANWSVWLVRSRLEAETGHPAASLSAYRRARSLNPRSPLFQR